MAFKRDLFTGELVEYTPEHGVQRREFWPEGTSPHDKRPHTGSTYSKGWESTAMSVPIEQMQQFNDDARRHGTGAQYVPDPKCPSYAKAVGESRGSRRREMARRNYFDRSGGYGDQAPNFPMPEGF